MSEVFVRYNHWSKTTSTEEMQTITKTDLDQATAQAGMAGRSPSLTRVRNKHVVVTRKAFAKLNSKREFCVAHPGTFFLPWPTRKSGIYWTADGKDEQKVSPLYLMCASVKKKALRRWMWQNRPNGDDEEMIFFFLMKEISGILSNTPKYLTHHMKIVQRKSVN